MQQTPAQNIEHVFWYIILKRTLEVYAMLYYRFEYACAKELEESFQKQSDEIRASLCGESQSLNQKLQGKTAIYISRIHGELVTLCAAIDTAFYKDSALLLTEFASAMGLKGELTEASEITIKQFLTMLTSASRFSLIEDEDGKKKELGLDCFDEYRGTELNEELITKTFSKKQAEAECKKLLCSAALMPEIERIFDAETPKTFVAHPVHYIIVSDDESVRRSMRELLLGSLYRNGRLKSRRICIEAPKSKQRPWRHDTEQCFDFNALEAMYAAQDGGTAVLQPKGLGSKGEYADSSNEDLMRLVRLMRGYRRNVLTVIELERSNTQLYNTLMMEFTGLTVVRLEEDLVFANEARTYLKRKAKSNGVSKCASLLSKMPKTEEAFRATDLNRIYDKWFDEHLCTEIYAQYSDIAPKQKEEFAKPKGDAFAELSALIGLADAKSVIKQAIDYHKAQRLFAENGIKQERPSMHMVFTGNPGTAKTTVARLTAQIMKDNGLLSEGELIEVGRADLVGKYVGWTADIVKSKFAQARGSVLFIDEAYSLVDDRSGMFGDEAINTIVQEMENTRNDTVVIFAGYPDKMEAFLQRNPGLRSRIAFHVPFPDYSADELLAIVDMLAEKQQMVISEDARQKVCGILGKAIKTPDFGNGRFARNLFERAKMKQASRLLKLSATDISKKTVCELIADDFEWLEPRTERLVMEIGFRP